MKCEVLSELRYNSQAVHTVWTVDQIVSDLITQFLVFVLTCINFQLTTNVRFYPQVNYCRPSNSATYGA